MSTERVKDGINEELLSAWVDGELDSAQRQQVQAWLDSHGDDMARVQAWAADRSALAEHFKPVLQEPAPEALRATVWRGSAAPAEAAAEAASKATGAGHAANTPRWAMAAAAAGLLVSGALLGGGGVWEWQQQRHEGQLAQLRTQLAPGTAQGWVQRAAFAHSIYVNEPRHAVEVKAQEEHLSRWLTRRIDIPVKLFDLREQGFELVGGRLLPDGPGKSAQLMYQELTPNLPGAQPRRVTVYLRKPDKGTDAAFRYEQQGKLGMFYWVEEGAGYALVGELPREVLLGLSQAIYKQHPGPMPATPAAPAQPAQPAQPAAPASVSKAS